MKPWGARQVAQFPSGTPMRLMWRDIEGRWMIELQPLVLFGLGRDAQLPGILIGASDPSRPGSHRFDIRRSSRLRQNLTPATAEAEFRQVRESAVQQGGHPIGLTLPAGSPSIEAVISILRQCSELLPDYFLLMRTDEGGTVSNVVWKKDSNAFEVLSLRFDAEYEVLERGGFVPFQPFGPPGFPPAQRPGEMPMMPNVQVPRSALPPLPQDIEQRPSTVRIELPRWAPAALAVVLALVVGIVLLLRYRSSTPPPVTASVVDEQAAPVPAAAKPQGLHLEIRRSTGGIEIAWDRGIGDTLGAKFGMLQVTDGGQRVDIPLGIVELNSGKVLYVPRSTSLELLLMVFTPTGMVQETIRVVQGPGAAPAFATSRARSTEAPSAPPQRPQLPRNRGDTEQPKAVATNTNQTPAAAPPKPVEEAKKASVAPAKPSAPTTQASRTSEPPVRPIYEQARNTPPNLVVPIKPNPTPPANERQPAPETVKPPAGAKQEPADAPAVHGRKPPEPAKQASKLPVTVPPVAIRQVMPNVPTALRPLVPSNAVVEVKVTVDAEGEVTDAQVEETTGVSAHLARLSSAAARQWRFKPATVDGRPVSGQHILRFRFSR